MHVIFEIIKYSLIFMVVNLILFSVKSNKKTENKNQVMLPKAYLVIGIIGCIGLSLPIISILISNNYSQIGVLILALVIIILLILMILSQLNWKIIFDENGFQYITLFGHKINYSYSDIKKIKRNKDDIFILAKKRWIIIDRFAIGKDEFFDELNRYSLKNKKPM